jgi:two-component system, sensor histidine kinase and response regulator
MNIESRFAGALKRLGDDRELFQELASFFREDSPGLVDAIRTGLLVGDCAAIQHAAHSLRSLAANFDAEQVVATTLSMEQSCRIGEFQTVPALLARLETEVQSLRSALQELTAQSPSSHR